MFGTIIGHSENTDTVAASRDVIKQCSSKLGGMRPSACLVFASTWYDFERILEEVTSAFPGIPLSGCSSGGELTSVSGFRDDSVCLILFVSDSISMAAGIGFDASKEPRKSARVAVKMAKSDLKGNPSLCLAFPDNLQASPTAIIETLNEELGLDCPIFGGFAAAAEFAASEVFQFHGAEVHSDAVSVMLFSGPIRTVFGIINSSTPVGEQTIIEEVDGNFVTRIGGKSALSYYRDTFGPHKEPLLEMPISVIEENGQAYIRAAVEFDEIQESVRFYGHIPKGSIVQFTEETPEGVISDTNKSLQKLCSGPLLDWTPQSSLIFSCASRKWILGSQARAEADILRKRLPQNTPFAGFYSYGEIAPLDAGRSPKYHNCTMVALLLGEEKSSTNTATHLESQHLVSTSIEKPQQSELLERSLLRANTYLTRLERQKTLSGRMLRRLNTDLQSAKLKIEEQNQMLVESLTLAQQVQQSLLPHKPPNVYGLDIAGRSLYCDETGGDYFDYLTFPGSDRSVSIVVGDISGHGVSAALLMTTARAMLRMRASQGGTTAELITDVNRQLSQDIGDSGQFMTLFILKLDQAGQSIAWIRAGHDPALRYNPSLDQFDELKGEGLALGVLDDWEYREISGEPMKPGEVIVIGTDGIWETRNLKNKLFGRERLMEQIRRHSSKSSDEIVEQCFESIGDFRGHLPIEDDITMVAIKKV